MVAVGKGKYAHIQLPFDSSDVEIYISPIELYTLPGLMLLFDEDLSGSVFFLETIEDA